MNKKRASGQVLDGTGSSEFMKALNVWIVNRLHNDYGYDFDVQFTEADKLGGQDVKGNGFKVQLKSTAKKNEQKTIRLDLSTVQEYNESSVPVVLFKYYQAEDAFYYSVFQTYSYDHLNSELISKKNQKTFTIPVDQKLDIGKLKQDVDICQKRIHENALLKEHMNMLRATKRAYSPMCFTNLKEPLHSIAEILARAGFLIKTEHDLGTLKLPVKINALVRKGAILCHRNPEIKNADSEVILDIFWSDFLIIDNTEFLKQKEVVSLSTETNLYFAYSPSSTKKLDLNSLPTNIGLLEFQDGKIAVRRHSKANLILESYPTSKQFSLEHKIFTVHKLITNQRLLPVLNNPKIETGHDNTTYMHELKDFKSIQDFISFRTTILRLFQERGYEARESWAIFSGVANTGVLYLGFDFQSLIFSLENLNSKWQSMKSSVKNVEIVDSEQEKLIPNWHNDDFSYCISAEGHLNEPLVQLHGNISYSGGGRTYFYPPYLYFGAIFGAAFQLDLSVESVQEYDYFRKSTDVDQLISLPNSNLEPILQLIKIWDKYELDRLPISDPIYYLLKKHDQIVVIKIYDDSNSRIASDDKFSLEVHNGSKNYSYELQGDTLILPKIYREYLENPPSYSSILQKKRSER